MSTTPPTMTLDEAWENIRNKALTPLDAPVIFGGQFRSGCPRSQVVASAQKLDPTEALSGYLPRQKANRRNTIEQMARTLTARALNLPDRDVNLSIGDNGKRDATSRLTLHVSDKARSSLSDAVYSINITWSGQAIDSVSVSGGDPSLHPEIRRLTGEAQSLINSKPWQEGWGALHSALRSIPLWRATYLLTYAEQVIIADAWRAIARDAYRLLIGRADNPLDIALESISTLVKAELEQCAAQEQGGARQRRGTIAERLERAQQMSLTIDTLSAQLGEVDVALKQSNQALCERLEALLDEIPQGKQSAPPKPDNRPLRLTEAGRATLNLLQERPEIEHELDTDTAQHVAMLRLLDGAESISLADVSAMPETLRILREMLTSEYIAHA